jgi:hypothetical protein
MHQISRNIIAGLSQVGVEVAGLSEEHYICLPCLNDGIVFIGEPTNRQQFTWWWNTPTGEVCSLSWDVEKAKEIVATTPDREVTHITDECMRMAAAANMEMLRGLDMEYAMSVEISKPLIVVPHPNPRYAGCSIIIDGWHRVTKRIMTGDHNTVPVVILTQEESKACIVHRSGSEAEAESLPANIEAEVAAWPIEEVWRFLAEERGYHIDSMQDAGGAECRKEVAAILKARR